MTPKRYLVTGGLGFLGAVLVRRLLAQGHRVRVLDNGFRGRLARLADVRNDFELLEGDVREPDVVLRATQGVDTVCHLASINGTQYFYTQPDLVLDVSVRGIVNVISACMSKSVGHLVVASSSEVYQSPPNIPTSEKVPLSIPDPWNPRYSYAAGKIASEMMAIHYGKAYFQRVTIFRPHNVYGPDMGRDHVIPQMILRMQSLRESAEDPVPFPIQGTGDETRAFVFIDDFTDGLMLVLDLGEHLEVYNIGSMEEVSVAAVAHLVGEYFGRRIKILPGEAAPGSPARRCPDISKLAELGYKPKRLLREGLPIVAAWYEQHGICDQTGQG